MSEGMRPGRAAAAEISRSVTLGCNARATVEGGDGPPQQELRATLRVGGGEMARRLREEPWGKQMVLIAVTGWGQAEDKRRSAEAGFDHHVVKPADPLALAKLLGSLARKS